MQIVRTLMAFHMTQTENAKVIGVYDVHLHTVNEYDYAIILLT
jgi:hypothetical protein